MTTPITDLIPMFDREINVPNASQITASAGQKLGYIEDGFWDARLSGLLPKFTVVDGADTDPPGTTGTKYFTDASTKSQSLDQQYWMMIVIFAGYRLLRLRIMQLAVNFTAEAGPVSYEQQASATVLRALLENLQRRVDELKALYSDEYGSTLFYMDGVAQATYADFAQLADLTVLH